MFKNSKASTLTSLDLLSINTWPRRVNKNMALHFDSVYTAFLFSFLSLLAHSLPGAFPPVEPISSAAQSLLCTKESEVLISPAESDETDSWFFQPLAGPSFQKRRWPGLQSHIGTTVFYDLLASLQLFHTQVCSPTSRLAGAMVLNPSLNHTTLYFMKSHKMHSLALLLKIFKTKKIF